MATCFEFLVQMTITFLLLPSLSDSKNSSGVWILNLRQSEVISVLPDGHIRSSSSDPTLYSLFRVQTYRKGVLNPLTFTLESMATNTFICMDNKGNLVTKARITEPSLPGRKQKRSPPSNQCIFRQWNFEKNDWNQMIGIYMDAPKSNGTKGLFMAFDKQGQPIRFRRRFSKLRKSLSILIRMQKPKSLRQMIRRTRFHRCDGLKGSKNFNRSVRRCLEADPDLVLPSKVHRKNVLKLIQRCQKEVERKFCSKKNPNHTKNSPSRSKGHEESTQEHLTSKGAREELDSSEPCHCHQQ